MGILETSVINENPDGTRSPFVYTFVEMPICIDPLFKGPLLVKLKYYENGSC